MAFIANNLIVNGQVIISNGVVVNTTPDTPPMQQMKIEVPVTKPIEQVKPVSRIVNGVIYREPQPMKTIDTENDLFVRPDKSTYMSDMIN